MEEVFEIFNEKNELVGTAPRTQVHLEGLIHRGVHLFLVNAEGKVFLQKRSMDKDTAPGHWDMSMAEHCKPGETYQQTARRGLKEELNLEASPTLLRVPKRFHWDHENGAIDNEFDALFLVRTEEVPKIDMKEVIEGRFFSLEEIEQNLKEGKKKFTPYFLDEWPAFKKLTTETPGPFQAPPGKK